MVRMDSVFRLLPRDHVISLSVGNLMNATSIDKQSFQCANPEETFCSQDVFQELHFLSYTKKNVV